MKFTGVNFQSYKTLPQKKPIHHAPFTSFNNKITIVIRNITKPSMNPYWFLNLISVYYKCSV